MIVSKIDDGKFRIEGAPIRGYDWTLIRSTYGTYARVAGATDGAPDEEIIIEEWTDPERRARWDGLTPMACAAAARRQVLEDIGDGFTETAKDIAGRCKKSANWVRKLGPEIESAGLAQRAGTSWIFSPEAADYITRRPDRRGRPTAAK